jgi:hypothetical protein
MTLKPNILFGQFRPHFVPYNFRKIPGTSPPPCLKMLHPSRRFLKQYFQTNILQKSQYFSQKILVWFPKEKHECDRNYHHYINLKILLHKYLRDRFSYLLQFFPEGSLSVYSCRLDIQPFFSKKERSIQ